MNQDYYPVIALAVIFIIFLLGMLFGLSI